MRILFLLLTWFAFALPAAASPSAPASEAALRDALAAGAAPKAAVAPGPQRTERIEAELVAMGAWATPGSTAVLAIRQKIKPGWHTYWRNQGDSVGIVVLAVGGPHTAVALAAARRLDRNGAPIVALSTAHPSKFGAFVSNVIGVEPEPAPVIRALGDRPERLTVIENTPEAALAAVKGFVKTG